MYKKWLFSYATMISCFICKNFAINYHLGRYRAYCNTTNFYVSANVVHFGWQGVREEVGKVFNNEKKAFVTVDNACLLACDKRLYNFITLYILRRLQNRWWSWLFSVFDIYRDVEYRLQRVYLNFSYQRKYIISPNNLHPSPATCSLNVYASRNPIYLFCLISGESCRTGFLWSS